MSKVQGLCALTWFNGKKLTEQLLNVSLISFRSLQLRTSNKQWAKTLTGMKVPPPLTQQSSARAEPASAVQCRLLVRFLPILCARLGESQTDSQYQGMEEKLVKWEKGKGWMISKHPVTAVRGRLGETEVHWKLVKQQQCVFKLKLFCYLELEPSSALSCLLFLPRLPVLFAQVKWEFLRTPARLLVGGLWW